MPRPGFKSLLLKCNRLFSAVPAEQLCETLLRDSQESPREQAKPHIFCLELLLFLHLCPSHRSSPLSGSASEQPSSEPCSSSQCGAITSGHSSMRRGLREPGGTLATQHTPLCPSWQAENPGVWHSLDLSKKYQLRADAVRATQDFHSNISLPGTKGNGAISILTR